MSYRVVQWSTGNVGKHSIIGIDANPELELVGCFVSNPEKAGKDAGRLAGLDRDLGVIATTDAELLEMVSVEWCTQRLINLYTAWRETLVDILYRLGLESVAALRGRTDLLSHLDYETQG